MRRHFANGDLIGAGCELLLQVHYVEEHQREDLLARGLMVFEGVEAENSEAAAGGAGGSRENGATRRARAIVGGKNIVEVRHAYTHTHTHTHTHTRHTLPTRQIEVGSLYRELIKHMQQKRSGEMGKKMKHNSSKKLKTISPTNQNDECFKTHRKSLGEQTLEVERHHGRASATCRDGSSKAS